MMINVPDLLGVAMPFVSGALGVGVAYGVLKSQINEHARRITKLELTVDMQVGEARCRIYRDDCRADLKEDIKEIKREVTAMRDWLQPRFDEIFRFIGKGTPPHGKE